MTFVEDVNNFMAVPLHIVDTIQGYVWYIGFAMLIAAGLFFLYKFKGMQITRLAEQIKLIKPSTDKAQVGTSKISSFQAFCVGLGARIGVGNITGVATAMIMGGPGAIFWMWIFALIGACTSFVECTLGQLFKEKKADGQFHGGPAYYIKNGLKNHKFAILMAVWIIVTYGVADVANQAANASSAFEGLVDYQYMPIVLAVIFAALTAYLVFGGVVRVAQASQWIVPAMAIAWMGFAVIAIFLNFKNIGTAFALIIGEAFSPASFMGGFTGSCIMWGLKRGVFSNEAGIGSVANVASSAHVDHPVHQGYIQSIGVLIDTIVVCSATAFLIMTVFPDATGGLLDRGYTKADPIFVIQDALSLSFGLGLETVNWTTVLLAVFMFVFAFSSLISYYSMSEANLRFISDTPKAVFGLRVAVVAIVFVACILPVDFVWAMMDLTMAGMAIMNIYVLFKLYKYVVAAHDDYRKQKDAGVEVPKFSLEDWDNQGLDTSGILVWNKADHQN